RGGAAVAQLLGPVAGGAGSRRGWHAAASPRTDRRVGFRPCPGKPHGRHAGTAAVLFPAAVAAPAGSTATTTAAGSGGHLLPCRYAGARWRPCRPAAAAGRRGGSRRGAVGPVCGRLAG